MGRYDKIHLVPFGEYVPLSGVIGFVRGWAEFIADLEPGSRAVVFPGPPAPFGVVICYEGIFPELFREFVDGGARVMVNMTNDAWFGRTSGPGQHLAMYPLRAVEHRVAIVRAANTGVSAFVEPTGRIVRHLRPVRARRHQRPRPAPAGHDALHAVRATGSPRPRCRSRRPARCGVGRAGGATCSAS